MEELIGLDLFDSMCTGRLIRLVRLWLYVVTILHRIVVCTLHWARGMFSTLHAHLVLTHGPPRPSPVPAVDNSGMNSRQRHGSTPEVERDIFNYVIEQAHVEVFGGAPLWGRCLQKDKCFEKSGHVPVRCHA